MCSNEGSSYKEKNNKQASIDQIIDLSEILLNNTPLGAIDFSGGEPTIHTDFANREFKLLMWTKKHPRIRFSLHSNGICLDPDIIDKVKGNFSRIGISIHSFNFKTWNKISNLKNSFTTNVQKIKFKRLINNIKYLSRQDIGNKVFLKSVVIKGVNDSQEELKSFLDYCLQYRFHPKFLEFEPQCPGQKRYMINREQFVSKLQRLGCRFMNKIPLSDKNVYVPAINFTYKNAPMGIEGLFGCGTKSACSVCYDYLCMFIKPSEDGNGLYLKPCAVLDTRIDLSQVLIKRDFQQIFDLFKISREYLMLEPGLGVSNWGKTLDK
jgi:molybdenum cofactor biosynthesis enzyme MoaA